MCETVRKFPLLNDRPDVCALVSHRYIGAGDWSVYAVSTAPAAANSVGGHAQTGVKGPEKRAYAWVYKTGGSVYSQTVRPRRLHHPIFRRCTPHFLCAIMR